MQLDWHRAWLKKLCVAFKDPLQRERDRIRAEIHGVYGLVRLFMKQRNGARWTAVERRQLVHELFRICALGPYLVALMAPGSFVLIPMVAWWLDRRGRARRYARIQPSRPVTVSMKPS